MKTLLHAKRLHQHLLPDGILFLGADPDIADLHAKSPVSIGCTHMGYRNALPIASVFPFDIYAIDGPTLLTYISPIIETLLQFPPAAIPRPAMYPHPPGYIQCTGQIFSVHGHSCRRKPLDSGALHTGQWPVICAEVILDAAPRRCLCCPSPSGSRHKCLLPEPQLPLPGHANFSECWTAHSLRSPLWKHTDIPFCFGNGTGKTDCSRARYKGVHGRPALYK